MSQNLENLFKESLQNAEAPYNPQAWEALQSRLDAAMPVATPKKPFNPWKASAIVVGVVGISAIAYFLTSSPTKSDKRIETKVAANNSSSTKSIAEGKTANNITKENTINASADKVQASKISTVVLPDRAKSQTIKQVEKTTNPTTVGKLATTESQSFKESTPELKANERPSIFILPVVSKHCKNEELSLNNTNNSNLVMIFPSGKKQTITANKQVSIGLTESGIYKLTDANSEKENTFVVNAAKEPDFEIDLENIYKNGVPSTVVNTTAIASDYKWTNDHSNRVLSGKENEFHFFKAGKYTVELEITDQNGCKGKSIKTINVADNYNLMAVDAFNPTHNDPRRNTFMPFALKERNTGFTLMIIDPKEGGVVYQTKDASAGWDGIDRRTGNQATNGANYIWKVTLSSPLAGESDNYKGIVIVTR